MYTLEMENRIVVDREAKPMTVELVEPTFESIDDPDPGDEWDWEDQD
jgi:hypothetical protein